MKKITRSRSHTVMDHLPKTWSIIFIGLGPCNSLKKTNNIISVRKVKTSKPNNNKQLF